jgi:3-dehydrosphinganine reductase
MKGYQGKKVFVTGGSSGIGRATAAQLSRLGADVAIGARDSRRLNIALGQIEGLAARSDQRFFAVPIDVADKTSVAQAAREVVQHLGGLDLLINNAGIARPGPVQDLDEEIFESMMRVNYFGAVTVTRALLPQLLQRPGGHISFVSSLLGFMGVYGYTAYAASKFAIVGFAECLRQEVLPHGVGVSILYPPDTDTPQLEEENRHKPAETKAVAGNVKTMTPEAVAEAYLDGIAAGKLHIVPSRSGRFTHFMYRHFPWMVRWVIDGDLKKAIRQQKDGPAG